MAYKIGDACVACGACAAQCPVSAIEDKGGKYEIKPEVCVSCGACAAQCPVSAISVTDYIAPGKKKPAFEIDHSKCIKCGACMEGCKFNAISKG